MSSYKSLNNSVYLQYCQKANTKRQENKMVETIIYTKKIGNKVYTYQHDNRNGLFFAKARSWSVQ
jgi:hypothetical protein